jgi:hypothetical protein
METCKAAETNKEKRSVKWYPMNQVKQIMGKQKARMVLHKSDGAN